MNSGGERKKEIKGPFPSARLHSMGSFLKGIIEVCAFLLRFVLVNFSGALRWGGMVCPPSPSALGKKLCFRFFLIIFFCCRKHAPCTHVALAQKRLEPPLPKTKMGFSLGFHQLSLVFSSVASRSAKPQASLQEPAQVLLESISGMAGVGSISGLSPALSRCGGKSPATVAALQKLSCSLQCSATCWCNYDKPGQMQS